MSVREGFACGVPVRLARVSFTGELGFEVNAPSDYALGVFEAIWAEGEKRGAVAYGLDVLLALRAEKGFIIVGQDTDGTVTARRSRHGQDGGDVEARLRRQALARRCRISRRPGRKQLVGLLSEDPAFTPDEGAQIVADAEPKVGAPALGHITSSYMSATLGRSFCLALVADGRARLGQTLYATGMEAARPVTVVEPVFYDKEGSRLDA